MENRRVGANVNITPPGGAYRWHYDPNAVTAIVYLNEVPGGQTERYPNFRLRLKQRYSRLQRWLGSCRSASPRLWEAREGSAAPG